MLMLQMESRVLVKPPCLQEASRPVSADGVSLQACPCGQCQPTKRRAPAAALKIIQPDVSPRNAALAGHTQPEIHHIYLFFFFFERLVCLRTAFQDPRGHRSVGLGAGKGDTASLFSVCCPNVLSTFVVPLTCILAIMLIASI